MSLSHGYSFSPLINSARLDARLSEFVEKQQLVGLSALIYEQDREAYCGLFGMADRERNLPYRRDTIVQIYSMTKPITGVTLMTLYEEGKFALDDRLDAYLPEFANMRVWHTGTNRYEPLTRPILIADILRHTAGFMSAEEIDPYLSSLWQESNPMVLDNSLAEMACKLASLPLCSQPGSRWHYGPCVDVQAYLAEVLAGKPYAELVQERVLDPLAMIDTHYLLPEHKRQRLATMYHCQEDGKMHAASERAYTTNTQPHQLTMGGWGLVSTLDDYMSFARMLLGEGELNGKRILQPQTLQLMRQNMLPETVTDTSFLPEKGQVGFGINFAVRTAPPIDASEASGAVGEFFWDGLANTLFWVDPKHQVCAVLFNQFMPYGAVETHKAFRDAVYADDPIASARSTLG